MRWRFVGNRVALFVQNDGLGTIDRANLNGSPAIGPCDRPDKGHKQEAEHRKNREIGNSTPEPAVTLAMSLAPRRFVGRTCHSTPPDNAAPRMGLAPLADPRTGTAFNTASCIAE